MDSSRYAPWERRGAAANDYLRLDEELVVGDLESASRLSPTDALGFRSLFLTECVRFIEQREFEFQRYTEYAEDLERAVVYKMDWTKDRQEKAIYAFTIVTIVFLPLSAISSIFGMNTRDVRDMEFGQWLYWAVAVPVTVIIIMLGLWWMNELGNVVRWVVGRQPGRAAGVGHTAGPAAAAAADELTPYPVPPERVQPVLAEMQEAPAGWYAQPPLVARRRISRPQSSYYYASR